MNEKNFTSEDTEITEERRRINRATEAVIGAAIDVHRALGPGLLESAYEICVCRFGEQLQRDPDHLNCHSERMRRISDHWLFHSAPAKKQSEIPSKDSGQALRCAQDEIVRKLLPFLNSVPSVISVVNH